MASYLARLVAEERAYRDCAVVHDLPDIFHYWTGRYIRPMVEPFGFRSPVEFYAKHIIEGSTGVQRFASIGCGNGELEIELALDLRSRGYSRVVVDCIDMNATMLERGRAAASDAGLSEQLNFLAADLNEWTPAREYHGIIANQFLHHVANLEGLFAKIRSCLTPDGCFLISDIIGRNGHRRWPEALEIVQEFWAQLPPSYRYNHELRRYWETFRDWDCSQHGFEGIRSQDILPLLLANFEFRLFVGFANVIDPFVDRSFGYNFDASSEWDRAFIDRVHERDEQELRDGRIKPTHMFAVVGKNSKGVLCREGLTPEFCVRVPESLMDSPMRDAAPYQPGPWPPGTPNSSQLDVAYARLAESEARLSALQAEFEERTKWALQLSRQLEEEQNKILELKHRPWRSLMRVLSRSRR
jgi:SAM-dependent methyltransferase